MVKVGQNKHYYLLGKYFGDKDYAASMQTLNVTFNLCFIFQYSEF